MNCPHQSPRKEPCKPVKEEKLLIIEHVACGPPRRWPWVKHCLFAGSFSALGIPIGLWHWVSEVFKVQGHAAACADVGELQVVLNVQG